ncbi:MAG: DUF2785 domain-containing protein [Comamonadaceae bacterium]|nr:DUF2785 domain-containing protein [Comamonadaceae bacterium]
MPAGESVAGLVREAIGPLGSPDPVWRDDVGYGVMVSCVYRGRRLDAAQRREVIDTLSASLRRGIGDAGTLTRRCCDPSRHSTSSILAASPSCRTPRWTTQVIAASLDDALAYLRDERDLRGIDPSVGWIHATAHTADLLKFLARDPRPRRRPTTGDCLTPPGSG